MKSKLLLTTAALSITLGASGVAIAQDRSSDDAKHKQTIQQPDRTQNKLNEQQRSQTNGQAPSSTQTPSSSQTQNAPASTTQQQNPGNASGTGTSSSGTAQSNQPSSSQSPASAQTTQPSANQPSSAQTNQPSTNRPSSAQTNQPSSSQPSSAQTTPSNQTQQPSTAAGQTGQQPSTAQQQQGANGNRQAGDAQTNVRLSASLQTEQKTRLNQAVAKLSVQPVTNVNFSVAVGTTVPQTVTLHPVPNEIVTVIPQYRGYDFFAVRDEIVIVEPSSHRIVDVIERSGGARAQSTTSQRKLNLSSQQREVIRKHYSSRRVTTGSAPRTRTKVIVGEEAPESVEIHSFPEEVYREVPEVRSYRYIEGDRGIYLVEPQGRRVIEDIE